MKEPPRFLRWLLRLYPSRHRRRYAEEMWAVVRHRTGRARGRARVAALAGSLLDLLVGALGVWRDTLGRWTVGMARGWLIDARFVARTLLRSRGYAATAVVVLAGAVAVSATVYSFVRGTLLHEPPYPEPDRIVVVWGSSPADGQLRDVISGPNYIDMAREARSLEPMAAFHHDGTYLTVDGHPEVIDALEVSPDFLEVLGVRPALGRDFGEPERHRGGERTIMVSHGFWRDHLGADPNAIGTSIVLEEAPRTIVGVLPEDFEFLLPSPIFLPLHDDVLAEDNRYRIHYNVIGRLAPGAGVADAGRELRGIFARIASEHTRYEGWDVLVEPMQRVSVSAVRPVLWTLAATVSLVLLVALVNLATLFRIRTLARAGEIGVRLALGAGRASIARVLSLETVALAGAGAVLGLLLAPYLLDRITSMVPLWIPIPESAARVPVLKAVLDPEVALVAFASAVLGALLLTAPSFTAAARRPAGVVHGGRVHAGMRVTRALVGLELAAATVLCLGAGLTARSAATLLGTDVGVRDEGLLTLYFGDAWDDDESARAYFVEAVEEIERLPGVRSAAVIDYLDFEGEDDFARLYFLDRAFQPVRDLREEWRRVGEGFFETAGVPVRSGRALERADFQGPARVAVVNESFAAKHYADGDAVGSYLSTHDETYRDLEVVGVVGDVRSLGPAAPAPPMLYVPHQGTMRGTQGLYVHVEGDPMAYAPAVRDAIWSVDPSQPITNVVPMSERIGAWVAIPRATRALVGTLAVLALALAAVGIFGVVAYAVRSGRSELGIRLALGATPDRLEVDLLRTVAPLAAAGIGAGVVLGLVAARAAEVILYGVSPLDPVSALGAVAAMASAALLATWIPARRVARIDPTEVIRSE